MEHNSHTYPSPFRLTSICKKMLGSKICLLLLACCVVSILLVNFQTVNSSRPNCSDPLPKDSSQFRRNTLQHALEEESLLQEDDMDHLYTLSAVTLKGGRGGRGRGGRGGGRGRGGRGRGGRGSRGSRGSRGGKGSRGSKGGSRSSSGRGSRGSRSGGRGRGSRGSRSGSRSSSRSGRNSGRNSGKSRGGKASSSSSSASSKGARRSAASKAKATNKSPTDLGRVSVTARRTSKTKTTQQQQQQESKETKNNRTKSGGEGLHIPFTMEALNIMFKAKKKFDGFLGPHTQRLPPIPFVSDKQTSCVACRVDCLKRWNGLDRRSIFSKCKKQFYYYGCDKIAPCLRTRGNGANLEEVEGMLGICYDRNGCELDRLVATQYVKLYGIENASRRIAADIMSENQDTQ